METILISPEDIESCWEKENACLVKMKSGKVWICERIYTSTPIPWETKKVGKKLVHEYRTIETTTKDHIGRNKNEKLIEIKLKGKSE